MLMKRVSNYKKFLEEAELNLPELGKLRKGSFRGDVLVNKLKDVLNEHVKLNIKIHSSPTSDTKDIIRLEELDTLKNILIILMS